MVVSCAITWQAQTGFAQGAVQLPEFNFSTVNTTVTAPDGGTVLLGSINRVAEGSTDRGVPLLGKVPGLNRLFKNRGIGREVGARNFTVNPRIIILEEEEQRQVGRPSSSGTAFGPALPSGSPRGLAGYYNNRENAAAFARAAALSGQIRQQNTRPAAQPQSAQAAGELASGSQTAQDAASIKAKNAHAASTRSAEAITYFERANDAAKEGKHGAAKIYYRMAARRTKGEFREQILQAMEALAASRQSPPSQQ